MNFVFKSKNKAAQQSEKTGQGFDQLADEIRTLYQRLAADNKPGNLTTATSLAELKIMGKKIKAARALDKQQRKALLAFVADTTGLFNLEQQEWLAALAAFDRARLSYEKMPDKHLLVGNLVNSARAQVMSGQTQKGLDLLERALRIAKAEAIVETQGEILYQLGLMQRLQNQADKALEYFQQGLLVAGQRNDHTSTALLLGQLAQLYNDKGETDKSQDYYERSLTLLEQTNDPERLLLLLAEYNQRYPQNHNPEKALEYAKRGVELANQTKNIAKEMSFLHDLGQVYVEQQAWEQVQSCGQQQLELARQTGSLQNEVEALALLGQAALGLQQLEQVRQWSSEGLEKATRLAQKQNIALFLSLRADLALAEQQPQTAVDMLEQIAAILRENNLRANLASLYLRIAEICLNQLQDLNQTEKIGLQIYQLSHDSNKEVAMFAFVSTIHLLRELTAKQHYGLALNMLQPAIQKSAKDYKILAKNPKTSREQKDYRILFFEVFTIMGMTVQDLVENKRQYYKNVRDLVGKLTNYFGNDFMMDEWTTQMYERIP
jgi:tetratricopeptide (TPR) repeat protein